MVWTDRGWSLAADRVIALPRLEGPRVRGFRRPARLRTGRRVHPRARRRVGVRASATSPPMGIKQGGLAAQQADVAAQVIAATAGADVQPQPYRPVLRGMLLTGGQVRYLRHEPDGVSDVSDEALWWPPHKVAGHHLAHYLASHTDLMLPEVPGPRPAAMS